MEEILHQLVDGFSHFKQLFTMFHRYLQGGAPQVISWFIMPLTVDISPINPSYWSYKPIMLSRGHLVGTMFPQNRPEAELV
jgi:hypothetical protein